jgi:hypothetical protein
MPKIKPANLGFCYHEVMKKGETKDFMVYLSITKQSSEVKNEIRLAEKQQMELVQSTDSCQIYTVQVSVFRYITVSLLYDKSDFELTPIVKNERQEIDSVYGNNWHWKIKAITDKPTAIITLLIEAETPSGSSSRIDNREIPIKIKVDTSTGFRRFLNFLLENPGVTIPSILIPLIGFLYKLWSNRKKKKA